MTNVSPHILAPESDMVFVDSDIDLRWDWQQLASDQRYVLRLWYTDQTPREVWTEETIVNASELIDSYSQDIGTFSWQVAVVNTDETGGFESMASEWSTVQQLTRVRRLPLDPLPDEALSNTARFIKSQNHEDVTALIDFTQNWMFENTLIGEELSGYRPDYSDAAEMMYLHAQSGAEAPQMYCNGISTTMLTVLRELGIESRIVYLYGQVPGWIAQHTVLEVFNPDTQRWQVHDPTANLYYVDTATAERATIERMVFGDLSSIDGCDPDECNNDSLMSNIRNLLGAFRYGFSFEVWVNPDQLDINRRIEAFDNMNFPEFIADISGTEARNIVFRFDSWHN